MQAVIVKMVKMTNCHVWEVKVKESVSDYSHEDQGLTLTRPNNNNTDNK